jgi:hypothetical protein
MLDGISLAPPIWVDQLCNNQAVIIDAIRLSYSQRISSDGLDGTPDIDDLYASLKQLICIFGKMMWDAGQGSFVGLVDVDALHGAASR